MPNMEVQVPKRVRLLLWKACRDCLPTRMNLQKKGISCPSTCTLCEVDLENPWHLFITCPHSIICWEELGLWSLLNSEILVCEFFAALCFKRLSSLDSNKAASFAMCICFLQL